MSLNSLVRATFAAALVATVTFAATLPAPPRRSSCRTTRKSGIGASGLIRLTCPHR